MILVLVAAALTVRLGTVQIRDGPKLAREALAQHDQTVESFAKRGAILDRDGGVLVRSLPSESIYAVPPEVIDPHGTAVKLAPILGKPVDRLEPALRDHAEFRWLARKVSHAVAERVDKLALPGINRKAEDTGRRFIASGRLGSTVLGFTDTDEKGVEGLEYALDSTLRGTSGLMRIEADQFGRAIPFGETQVVQRATAGKNVVTTLDPYVQFEAERLLRDAVKKWSSPNACAIVMDPWTGEILALANMPDYDPSRFAAFPEARWRDRAVTDAYEPGSTFKLITAAAALESGRVRSDARFPARDALEVGGRVIHNAEDGMMAANIGGSESIEQIIAYSHNVGAAEIGLATGPSAMYRTIKAFGFGEPSGVELPGESPGIVNAPADWSGSTLPTIAFGHSISVTPIAMVRAYAAIANGGLLLRPRIVSAIEDPSGKIVRRYGPVIDRRVISERTAATLRGYLRAVVLHGTGNPTARVPGYTTAGKTGTAQVVGAGGYLAGAYIASFIGMIPAERPRYVILVKVERPRGSIYGSAVAAPVFAALARAAMLHAEIMPATGPARHPAPAARLVTHASTTKRTR
ncbi:MAG TPA: penicillin-binding protein 2 [Candidatus Elarobacter sp.]|nr:penicillin-binding protein 2 [Candidatus Elarobacter sp.]